MRYEAGNPLFRNNIPASINILFDKLVVFLCCLVAFFLVNDHVSVIPVLVTVTFSSFNTYFEKRSFTRVTSGIYLIFSMIFHEWFYFMPVMAYDALLWERPWIISLAALPVLSGRGSITVTGIICVSIYLAMAWFMEWRSTRLIFLEKEYRRIRDSATEALLSLEAKNKELLEKQDYEINLATLNERNRIAREIHDNIGHILSSALLQIGALLTVTPNGPIRDMLATLKETISSGMDSIRNSIHNLHDASVDLHAEIYGIIKSYNFCPVIFTDDLESKPPLTVTYCFLAVIKEALSNTAKHSDASEVRLILREHPAIYQLIIRDNGSKPPMDISFTDEGDCIPDGRGIGLRGIKERVERLNGMVRIRYNMGFEIFISIPKES